MQRTSLHCHATRLVVALGLAHCCSPANAQQTLVVGAGGFPTIMAAIAAAIPGDTVLVNGGDWHEAIDIDKGIRFVGRNATLRHGLLIPPVQIHDVPAGQMFVMVGFQANPTTSGDSQVDVRDCNGIVSLQGLSSNGTNRWWLTSDKARQLHVSRCAARTLSTNDTNVVLEQCVVDPSFALGVAVFGGRAAIVDCSISHGSLPVSPVWLDRTEAVITRTTISQAGSMQPAIRADRGALVIDPSCRLLAQSGIPVQGSAAYAYHEIAALTTATTGSTLTMSSHGPTGAPGLVLMSQPQPETVTNFGFAWVDPNAFAIVTSLVFPAGRLTTASMVLPPLPPGLTAALQVAHLTPTGIALSTPSLVANP
ncbi:MAG: hypothetical protein NXI31_23970 [bacterium]|nr:hypothetical protein [bacterium]